MKKYFWFQLIFFIGLLLGLSSKVYGQVETLSESEKYTLEIVQSDNGMFIQSNAPQILLGSKKIENTTGTISFPADMIPDRKGKLTPIYYGVEEADHLKLYHISSKSEESLRVKHIPLWLSILPPLIAILFALLIREVIVSLIVGIWMGSFIAGGMRLDSMFYLLQSLSNVITDYVIRALNDFSHLAVIIFSLLIGGMVAIISKNGGMTGVVNSLSKYAATPASAQFVTWFLGIAIFFDDYANTLIVGNTMRPVTDRFKISREKLAYIVDSTAAPVAAIAFITTWIGAELGYIDSGIQIIGSDHINLSPYAIFLQSLRYSFYPVLTLVFIFFLIKSGKEYGPMHHAETRARLTGQVSSAATPDKDEPNMENLSPVSNAPNKWIYAVIPIATVILVTFYGLLHTGIESIREKLIQSGITFDGYSWSEVWSGMNMADPAKGFLTNLGDIIGQADPYIALLWSSFAGVTISILMTVGGRIIKLSGTMHYLVTGFKTMIPAVIILTLAWSLAITTEELRTAEFLTMALQDSLNPYLLPGLVFILAALTSFSTGSSWSTMAILYPIAIPTSWAVSLAAGLSPEISLEILFNTIAVVLAASVLGDHCSPISDTTILSSLASDCNHIDHVRTQLPYALTVGVVSLLAGTISTVLGGGWVINTVILLLSMVVLWVVIRKVGKTVPG